MLYHKRIHNMIALDIHQSQPITAHYFMHHQLDTWAGYNISGFFPLCQSKSINKSCFGGQNIKTEIIRAHAEYVMKTLCTHGHWNWNMYFSYRFNYYGVSLVSMYGASYKCWTGAEGSRARPHSGKVRVLSGLEILAICYSNPETNLQLKFH